MSHKIILQNLGDACGGSWDSIYDAALVATSVLKNVKAENALLKESLSELGGTKYFEEWLRLREQQSTRTDDPDRVGKCHLRAPLEICTTLRCEDCVNFYK